MKRCWQRFRIASSKSFKEYLKGGKRGWAINKSRDIITEFGGLAVNVMNDEWWKLWISSGWNWRSLLYYWKCRRMDSIDKTDLIASCKISHQLFSIWKHVVVCWIDLLSNGNKIWNPWMKNLKIMRNTFWMTDSSKVGKRKPLLPAGSIFNSRILKRIPL